MHNSRRPYKCAKVNRLHYGIITVSQSADGWQFGKIRTVATRDRSAVRLPIQQTTPTIARKIVNEVDTYVRYNAKMDLY